LAGTSRLLLEIEVRPQSEKERRSRLEYSGVNRLDIGRQGEPISDRGVVVELEALLVAARRDLSRGPTLDTFLEPNGQFLRNRHARLMPGGQLALLMEPTYGFGS
jgi:hypothetical protein